MENQFIEFLKKTKPNKKITLELNGLNSSYPNLVYPETEIFYKGKLDNLYSIYRLSQQLKKKRNKQARGLAKELLVVFNASTLARERIVGGQRDYTTSSARTAKFSGRGETEGLARYTAEDVRTIMQRYPHLQELHDAILREFRNTVRTRSDFRDFLTKLGYTVTRHSGDDAFVQPSHFHGRPLLVSVWEGSGKQARQGIRDPRQFFSSVVLSLTPAEGNLTNAFSEMIRVLFERERLVLSVKTLSSLCAKGFLGPIRDRIRKIRISLEEAVAVEEAGVNITELWNSGLVEITA